MKKRSAGGAIFLIAALIPATIVFSAQETKEIKVPEGSGAPVLTDGVFSPGEWDDALKIAVRPTIDLLLKKYRGDVFVGIRHNPFTISVVDLFISPDGKKIWHLHASAQIGERILNDTPGTADDPEFIWGDTTGWYANEIRWDQKKMEALMKGGTDQGRAQTMTLYKYDGFEFQIRQSKFGSGEWLVRLETPAAPDWEHPAVFPPGTDAASTAGWMKLILK